MAFPFSLYVLKSKATVVESFKKALIHLYGQEWPNSLKLALSATAWGREILPLTGAASLGDFAGLDDLSGAVAGNLE
jgi:hypothetical protein